MDSRSSIPLGSQYSSAEMEAINAATKHLDLDFVEDDYINLSIENNQNGKTGITSSSSKYLINDYEGMGFGNNNFDNLDEYDIYGEKIVQLEEKKDNNIKNKTIPDLNSDSLFPSLGSSSSKGTTWGSKKTISQVNAIKPSSTTKPSNLISQTFNLKLGQTPQASNQLRETVQKVQKRFNVTINVSSSQISGVTTFIIKGNQDKVIKAEREIRAGVSPKITATIKVPAGVTRFILGAKGRNLIQLQQKTMTSITVPPRNNNDEDGSDVEDNYVEVAIVGEVSGVQDAKKEIENIIREKAAKVELKVTEIPVEHYPFLAGPKGCLLKTYSKDSSVEVQIPFLFGNNSKDDSPITILGEKEAVNQAKINLLAAYEELKDNISELIISIPKPKHCFLIGPNGSNLKEFFSASGCIVNIPDATDSSNKVTITGLGDKLGQSVALLMDKANSTQAITLDIEKIHKLEENYLYSLYLYLIKTPFIKKLEREFNIQVQIPNLTKVSSKINIIGKLKEDIQKAKSSLEDHIKSFTPACFLYLNIPKELHNYLKGDNNTKLDNIKDKYKVELIVPEFNTDSNLISLHSSKADKKALNEVKSLIERDIKDFLNIDTKLLEVPNKVHRHIIGPNGNTIESIIGNNGESKFIIKFGSKVINGYKSPEYISFSVEGLNNNQISISGPKSEVERVSKEIEKLAVEMEDYEKARSYTTSFTIPAKHLAHIVGRNGSNINKLKSNFDVKIDIENNKGNKEDTSIKIQGVQKNADKVKIEIINQIEKLKDHTEEKLRIPNQYHKSIIGSQGKYVKRLEEKYSVFIKFPNSNIKLSSDNEDDDEDNTNKQNSKIQINKDEILIKGGKKGVSDAKAEIMEIVEYERENNNKLTFKVGNQYLAHILGRNGMNINLIKDETNTRIDVEKKSNNDNGLESTITVLGTKNNIKEAQKRILEKVNEIENTITEEIQIPSKFHSNLIGPNGSNIRQLIAKCQNIEINDPKVNTNMVRFNKDKSDNVVVKGDKQLVIKVIQALKEATSILENVSTIQIEINPINHASLIGRGGSIMKSIMNQYQVELTFPKRDIKGPEASIVTISGKLENCELAKKDLLNRIPSQQKFDLNQKYHYSLLGKNNFIIRKLRNELSINVEYPNVPKPEFITKDNEDNNNINNARIDDIESSDKVSYDEINYPEGDKLISWILKGSDENIIKAKELLDNQLKTIQNKLYVIRLYTHPSNHGLIVGRNGTIINQIRKDTKCSIELPPNNNNQRHKQNNNPSSLFSDGTAIIISGEKSNCLLAKQEIENIIKGRK